MDAHIGTRVGSRGLGWTALMVVAAACLVAPLPLAAQTTTRVSAATDGSKADDGSHSAAISADGRYVAFVSYASNIVAGDTNGVRDVFVSDWQTGTTARVSVSSSQAQANGSSVETALSGDGRFVVFTSEASNLVPGDTNASSDVFIHDRQDGTTTRISVASGGSEAWGDSRSPAVNADGTLVVFESSATNLVADDTNGMTDVFVRDRAAGTTTRVSVRTGGQQALFGSSWGPDISANGRFVAFASGAQNLAPSDTNGVDDVFVHDRLLGSTTRIDVAANGGEAIGGGSADPSLSGDGRYIAFTSAATNLVPGDSNGARDVFLLDTSSGVTTRVSLGVGDVQTVAGAVLGGHSGAV
jgi:Tol biopolymer transport system component